MPSFDITSEVNTQELDNAINQARKELSTRFDFRGSTASIELDLKESKIKLAAEDNSRVRALHDIVIGKLSKRGVDLRNVDRKDPAISPLGHATQELVIKQGLDGDKAKEIVKAIKEQGLKVQSALQERQIRVTGKSRDDLQAVIAFCRSKDFEVGLAYGNFRD
jgi:cyclic-di-GMP-binding protein